MDDSRINRATLEVLESGNQQKAKELLKEAGYPNGVSLDLDLSRFQSAGKPFERNLRLRPPRDTRKLSRGFDNTQMYAILRNRRGGFK